jgi:hypothetical protein
MAVTKLASRYGSSGACLGLYTFCARIGPSPPMPACWGTCTFCSVMVSALLKSPAVPLATTFTSSG